MDTNPRGTGATEYNSAVHGTAELIDTHHARFDSRKYDTRIFLRVPQWSPRCELLQSCRTLKSTPDPYSTARDDHGTLKGVNSPPQPATRCVSHASHQNLQTGSPRTLLHPQFDLGAPNENKGCKNWARSWRSARAGAPDLISKVSA
jgi:hypothetical protein